MDSDNEETTNEFFSDTTDNYSTEILNDNLKINSAMCFDYYYDEYIEIDGVIVNKQEWEKTQTIKVEEELESKMEAEIIENTQQGASSEVESRRKQQWKRIKNNTKSFECVIQDNKTLTRVQRRKYKRKSHNDQRGKWFKCDQCEFKTKWKNSLKTHNISVHIPEKQIKWFKCDQCDYKAKRRDNLKAHNILHIPEDQIKWSECDKCYFKTKWKSHLRRHNIYVHISGHQIKWFKCNQCDYKTKSTGGLRLHNISVHLPQNQNKWFECDQCDYKTKWKYDIKTHNNNVHLPQNQIKWFICDECKYKAKTKSKLKTHIISKHQNRAATSM